MSSPSDSKAQAKKFYLTTPIYYVNARPHIGHAYTTIVADVLARRHRLLGDQTFFLTGTDEHGQKIERSAVAAGVPPQQFADEVSASFRALWDRMGLTYDRYIRTTDESHKRGVQQLFTALYERGFIYLASYTGAYCVSDEAFVDVAVGAPCPDCGRVTESVTEENFFFKLSAFQRPLLDLIESGTLKVEPEARRNEVLSFLRGNTTERSRWPELWEQLPDGSWRSDNELLKRHLEHRLQTGDLKNSTLEHIYTPGALKDLSISRSSFTWGVPVPELALRHSGAKDKHVIYVWLDALANYMTAVGYGDPSAEGQAEFKKWWPADLHLVGKEIIRFHCVYWPAFLLALDPLLQHNSEEAPPVLNLAEHTKWAAEWLPKSITAHGWLLFDNSKMSKSKGNIVRTETILEAFGRLCPSLPEPPSPLSFRSTAEESASSSAEQVRPPTAHERDLFAADVLRYFLLREIPFGQDGSFSFEAMVTRYNADLANGYGNLVSRTLAMINRYQDSVIDGEDRQDWTEKNWGGHAFGLSPGTTAWSDANDLPPRVTDFAEDNFYKVFEHTTRSASLFSGKYGEIGFQGLLAEAGLTISVVDGFLSKQAPWKIAKDETGIAKAKLGEILYFTAESIRIITALLYPILPFATARVWAQLGLGDIEVAARNGELSNLQWGGLKPGTKLGPLAPIFPRADKSLIQIMTDMENEKSPMPAATTDDSVNAPRPDSPFKTAATPTPAAPVAAETTDPAAPPRSLDSLAEPSGMLPVAGSGALTTGPDATPSHSGAAASGVFAGSGSQQPINAEPSEASAQITIDDFAKVELRVAQIVVAERIPKADKLLRLEVDLGPDMIPSKRQILSGIAEWYTPEELVGRRIVVITNLAPRKMRGLESHGMLLAASNGEGGKPVLATFGEEIALGSRLK